MTEVTLRFVIIIVDMPHVFKMTEPYRLFGLSVRDLCAALPFNDERIVLFAYFWTYGQDVKCILQHPAFFTAFRGSVLPMMLPGGFS